MIPLFCLAVGLYLASQLRFAVLPCMDWLLRRRARPAPVELKDWPRVTVQLAVYRESQVLRGLLEAVLAMEAPGRTLTIQVLDDSSGEEARRTREVVTELGAGATRIEYLNRGTRDGFKAGALNHGLSVVESEFIAFFDADCVPQPGFLRRTLPQLSDPRVAAVQARWDFPNAGQSPLTQLQAAIFEWLFRYEITLRVRMGLPAFYMGSAAIWRTEAIRKLGGWQERPFTAEDLDLAYRAGRRGWRVVYHPGVVASTQAVEDLLAFRSQQRRWARSMLRVGWDHMRAVRGNPWGWPARLLDLTTVLTHSAAPLLLLASLAAAAAVLREVPRTPAWTALQVLFSAAAMIPPAGLPLLLAQRSYHADWPERVWRLGRALPEVLGLATSFLFGLADFLGASPAEFTATPKGGQLGVLQGSRHKWLQQHLGPLIAEGLMGGAILRAALQAIVQYPEAALPLVVVGTGLLCSFAQTLRAVWQHAARLGRAS